MFDSLIEHNLGPLKCTEFRKIYIWNGNFKFSKKATLIWWNLPVDFKFTYQTLNQLGDFIQFLWPS